MCASHVVEIGDILVNDGSYPMPATIENAFVCITVVMSAADAQRSVVCCFLEFSRFWLRYSQSMPIYAERKTRQTIFYARTGSMFFDHSSLMSFLAFIFSLHDPGSANRFWSIGVDCRTVGLWLCQFKDGLQPHEQLL